MRRSIPVLLVLAGFALPAAAAGTPSSHAEYFEHYEGTKTCLACHEDEATSFFHSQHYQWRGEAPQIVNAHGAEARQDETRSTTSARTPWPTGSASRATPAVR